jgi:hypothetical protein
MREADSIATEDKIAALRAIIQYLIGSGQISGSSELLELHPKSDVAKSEIEKKFRSLTRLNAIANASQSDLSEWTTAINTLLRKKDIQIPAYFHSAASIAGIFVQPRVRPNGIPAFIDYMELPTAAGTLEQNSGLIKAYEGCWRVYRILSPTDITDINKTKFGRGFLHIKPYNVLKRDKLNVAEFSLYQRGETKLYQRAEAAPILDEYAQKPSRLFGVLLQTNDYISLLGERAKIGVGMSYIGMMTWANIALEAILHKLDRFIGLSLMPTADGTYLSSYFIASFIENSDKFDDEEFLRLKEQELARVGDLQLEDSNDAREKSQLYTLHKHSDKRRAFFEL